MTAEGERRGWDRFAADYERHAIDNAYNALYDRPAVLELLGDVPDRLAGAGELRPRAREEDWHDGQWHVRYWREPLQSLCDAFADAGFLIERVVEPRPHPDMATRYPDDHAKLSVLPAFIAFRLLKPRSV
jgi:hypothetical protein